MVVVDKDSSLKIVGMIAGEEAVKIVGLLLEKPGLTDEDISSATSLDIKEVRRVLHRLNEVGAVSYEVHREKETGHRVFRWRVQQEQLVGYAKTLIRKVLERLKARLEYESNNQMYWCGSPGCGKYGFDTAMELLFRCKTCGKPLTIYENTAFIESLRNKIAELEKLA